MRDITKQDIKCIEAGINKAYNKGRKDGHIEGYRRGEKAGKESVRSALLSALGLEEMVLHLDINDPLNGRTVYVRKLGEHA